MMHIHLDAIGGVAGDMFAAALLDAFPEHADALVSCVQGFAPVSCRLERHADGTLSGSRFDVSETAPDTGHDHAHDHGHGHTHWSLIREDLRRSDLPPAVAEVAIGIFARLAEAEGRVHGVPPDEVAFHEVGAADSIADIVAAAWLIVEVGDDTGWSVSALPLGSGRVRTAHGIMPVPAPATTLLLEGFESVDDGVAGERVTPTGAAILSWLAATGRLRSRPSGRIGATGIGFGTRRLPGLSNCLRALVLHTAQAERGTAPAHRLLAVIGFEVDDQSGEDLATGLERLRELPGVLRCRAMADHRQEGAACGTRAGLGGARPARRRRRGLLHRDHHHRAAYEHGQGAGAASQS